MKKGTTYITPQLEIIAVVKGSIVCGSFRSDDLLEGNNNWWNDD